MTLREHTEKSIREKQQKICEKWDLFIAERESAVAELDELVEDEVIISGNRGSIIADPTRFAGQSNGDFSAVKKEHYLSFHSEYHAIKDMDQALTQALQPYWEHTERLVQLTRFTWWRKATANIRTYD